MYEDKVTGVITAERFAQMVGKTEIRRREAEDTLAALEAVQDLQMMVK